VVRELAAAKEIIQGIGAIPHDRDLVSQFVLSKGLQGQLDIFPAVFHQQYAFGFIHGLSSFCALGIW
jgi:hypothetical protein